MKTGTFHVDVEKRQVSFGHKTKTLDGFVEVTTTFDLSKVTLDRLLKRAADAELISWRARTGIKGLTTEEAMKTLADQVVDCSAIVQKVKHVETVEEKELRGLMKDAMASGASIKAIMEQARAILAKQQAAAGKTQTEDEAQAEMEQGEQEQENVA